MHPAAEAGARSFEALMQKIATLIVFIGVAIAASFVIAPICGGGPGKPAPMQTSLAYAGIRG
jgi:hypothetical protein